MKAPRPSHALAIALSAACGGAQRTSPATQPGVAAFDPAGSDPKALALVDQALAALGGREAWDKVKQIRWDQRYSRDGAVLGINSHAWDRWNGRHRYESVSIESMKKAEKEGRPDDVQVSVAMYDLFDHRGKGTVMLGSERADSATRDRVIEGAYKAFLSDSYRLAAVYKLKDPGVKLALDEPSQPIKDYCKPSCDVVRVTFAPEVGSDTWLVGFNSQSKLPELLAQQMGNSRAGYGLSAGPRWARSSSRPGSRTSAERDVRDLARAHRRAGGRPLHPEHRPVEPRAGRDERLGRAVGIARGDLERAEPAARVLAGGAAPHGTSERPDGLGRHLGRALADDHRERRRGQPGQASQLLDGAPVEPAAAGQPLVHAVEGHAGRRCRRRRARAAAARPAARSPPPRAA